MNQERVDQKIGEFATKLTRELIPNFVEQHAGELGAGSLADKMQVIEAFKARIRVKKASKPKKPSPNGAAAVR